MKRKLTSQEEREIDIALMQWASDCEYMEMMANSTPNAQECDATESEQKSQS